MQVSVETTQGLERRMTVALPSDDIDSAVHERLQNLSKTTRMNGFRPGKVPFKVVKKRYEPQVRNEVLGSMINRSFYAAVQQEKLRPAGRPSIEPSEDDDIDTEIGFRFIATFEVYPEFEPAYGDGIKVSRPQVVIEETDVDDMIENLRKQRTEYKAVERAAEDDDQLIIDFTGRIDGEEFDGGKAEKAPLVLGSNAMIPGFESQLTGMAAGEEKTIQITFPENYQADHLAGKEAEFDIHVHTVNEAALPELDEELVKSFGIEDGSVSSLRDDILKNMQRELKQRIDTQIKTQVMDGLVQMNPIDVPSALVGEEIERQKEQMMEKMPPNSDTSMLPDELFSEQARRRVLLGLVVGEIIQREQLKADAAAVRNQIEQMASSYQDPQQIIDYYYGNAEMLQNVESLVLEEAVTSAVLEAATVTDEPTTFKDIMNPPQPAAEDNENSE
ncbi:MAG: trigger factor [Granulosicoccus sp.]